MYKTLFSAFLCVLPEEVEFFRNPLQKNATWNSLGLRVFSSSETLCETAPSMTEHIILPKAVSTLSKTTTKNCRALSGGGGAQWGSKKMGVSVLFGENSILNFLKIDIKTIYKKKTTKIGTVWVSPSACSPKSAGPKWRVAAGPKGQKDGFKSAEKEWDVAHNRKNANAKPEFGPTLLSLDVRKSLPLALGARLGPADFLPQLVQSQGAQNGLDVLFQAICQLPTGEESLHRHKQPAAEGVSNKRVPQGCRGKGLYFSEAIQICRN